MDEAVAAGTEADVVGEVAGAAVGEPDDVVEVDDGVGAAGGGAVSALAGGDGAALAWCGEAVGAADVEDAVLAAGEDGGEVGAAEQLGEEGAADAAEAGELGWGGEGGVVGGDLAELVVVDEDVEVGSDAAVLGEAVLEDAGEEGLEAQLLKTNR